ncbi:flagellar hook-length control protein FliK [Siminovitchia sp. 179-K 8D1 HS]|uniref:flagellar hook-length control protein FliK n=1 Tax=Siminovitchia sp. 179-K 8D1 HS TaxID=3142385 RepID=UPI0039A2DD19
MRINLFERMPDMITAETGQTNVDPDSLFNKVFEERMENWNADDPPLLSEEDGSLVQELGKDVESPDSLLSEEDGPLAQKLGKDIDPPDSLLLEEDGLLAQKLGKNVEPPASLFLEDDDSVIKKLIEDIQHLVSLLTAEIKQELEPIDPQRLENMKQSLSELESTEMSDPLHFLQKLDEFISFVAESPMDHGHSISIQQLNQLAERLKSIADNPEGRKFIPFTGFLRTFPEWNNIVGMVQTENEMPESLTLPDKQKDSPFEPFTRPVVLPPANNQSRGEQQLNFGFVSGRQAYQEQAGSRISLDRDIALNTGLTEIHTKQYLSRLLDDGVREQEGRVLVRKLVSILRNAHFSNAHQTKQLTIRLYPENLGFLRVELFQKEGEMVARIIASTQMAKKMLDANLQHLKQGLANQNLQIEKVDVTHYQPAERHPFSDNRQGHNDPQGEQNRDQAQKENKENNEQHFTILLNDALFETKV